MGFSTIISDIMGVLLLKDTSWQKDVYALLSNAWSDARHNIERLFQLHTFVDLQIFSAEEGLAKPDPRLYQLALSRLEVQPTEVIFIDDRKENVLAAQQIGMHTILFEQNEQAIAALQSMLTD